MGKLVKAAFLVAVAALTLVTAGLAATSKGTAIEPRNLLREFYALKTRIGFPPIDTRSHEGSNSQNRKALSSGCCQKGLHQAKLIHKPRASE